MEITPRHLRGNHRHCNLIGRQAAGSSFAATLPGRDGCKVTYLFRVTDPYCVPAETARANDIVLTAFEDLVGCALTQQQRHQASLPLSTGGCGLKSPRLVKPAARIAALLAFLGGGCDKVAVPLYARNLSSAAITPVLEDLISLLGPQFESLESWQGRHDLLATADRAPEALDGCHR